MIKALLKPWKKKFRFYFKYIKTQQHNIEDYLNIMLLGFTYRKRRLQKEDPILTKSELLLDDPEMQMKICRMVIDDRENLAVLEYKF